MPSKSCPPRSEANQDQARRHQEQLIAERLKPIWKAGAEESSDELEMLVKEYTAELMKSNQALQTEIAERKRAEEELKGSREQLRNLAARLQSVHEEENTQIAREIHEALGQTLLVLKMDLSWLRKQLSRPENALSRVSLLDKISTMSQRIDTTINVVRRIATELRPSVLDNLGLVAAIEWQAQEFQTRTGIPCTFIPFAERIVLDQKRSTALFRICQESLTNVARHAGATAVTIRLHERAGNLILEVSDNGKGIPKRKIAAHESLGLLGMRERAFPLDGEVSIRGIPGKGTTVTARIPRR